MVGSNDKLWASATIEGVPSPGSPAASSNGVTAKHVLPETPKLADSAGASSRVEQKLGVLAAKLALLKVRRLMLHGRLSFHFITRKGNMAYKRMHSDKEDLNGKRSVMRPSSTFAGWGCTATF